MMGYAFWAVPDEFEPYLMEHAQDVRQMFWHSKVRAICRKICNGSSRPTFRWEPLATTFPMHWKDDPVQLAFKWMMPADCGPYCNRLKRNSRGWCDNCDYFTFHDKPIAI